MKPAQIQSYVINYLEATGCHIIEKSPAHVTVKLSPAADRDLTNRSYYWNFIERTGAEPETMTFTLIFDPDKMQTAAPPANKPKQEPRTANDSILGRYFGFVPTSSGPGPGRILSETVTFGSRRLDQIFHATKTKGRYLHLFEEPQQQRLPGSGSSSYSSWLGVNYKVELTCDMKRSEIHSLGISLSTGEIVCDFQTILHNIKLGPKLPPNTHVREMISLQRAVSHLEQHLEKKLNVYDHSWAAEAQERLQGELTRIESYYEDLIKSAEEDKKQAVTAQFANRKQEIDWQYRPRIEVSVINCGIFHLDRDTFHAK